MDWKEQPSILNHFLFINILRVENGRFLKPTVLRFEPRLMDSIDMKTIAEGTWLKLTQKVVGFCWSCDEPDLMEDLYWLTLALVLNRFSTFKSMCRWWTKWNLWHQFESIYKPWNVDLRGFYLYHRSKKRLTSSLHTKFELNRPIWSWEKEIFWALQNWCSNS